MKLGFPNHPRRNLLREIEWIGTHGFDFIDLFLEEDMAVPEKIDINAVRKMLLKHGLGATGHTAWYLPIGSPSRTLREAALKEAERYLEVFGALGVPTMTIHSNWPRGLFSAQEGVEFQIETLLQLVRLGRDHNVQILYEPVDSEDDNIRNVSTILDRVSELLLHIDLGHANLHRSSPDAFIREFQDLIGHIHLHDNFGRADLHLPPGCGSIDWRKTLKTLKSCYDGTITIEVFSRDKDYVVLAREKMRALWDSL
ncbi:MAG: sugar phosphate isomerase/epimerase family protein [Candidatus Xenobiia bacterium LiM19]